MRFSNLRELLLKKTQDPALRTLIKMAADEIIEQIALESLEKMARKGSSANNAISAAGGHVLPTNEDSHPHESMAAALIHDNLSHHLTNYKAALKAGNRDVADKHLEQAMKTIQYGSKLEGTTARKNSPEGTIRLRSGSTKPHSRDQEGNIVAEHHEGKSLISPTAWEMNYSGSEKKLGGVLKEVTKGWNRQTSKGKKADDMFPDYRYMEMTPHPHSKTELYGHNNSAYPFHDIQVNGRYVDIDEGAPAPSMFVGHPFDSHPGRGHAHTLSTEMGPNATNKFMDDHKAWLQSPQLEGWLADQEKKHENKDYANRGVNISNPIHDKPMENPHNLEVGRRGLRGAVAPATAAVVNKPALRGVVAPATAAVVNKPAPVAAQPVKEESKAAPGGLHPDVVGVIQKLGSRMPPEKISEMLNIPHEHVKAALEKK
jgi:hypothetical protein